MINILFRCDGSNEIGMGHIERCLVLANYIKNHFEAKINFAMRTSDIGFSKVGKYFPIIKSEEKNFNYYNWMTDTIIKVSANILILDVRDGLKKKDLRKIKYNHNIKIVTIDDPEDKRLESNLVFYPPVPQLEKMNWNNYKGKLNVGLEYYILNEKFAIQYKKINNKPKILISMGGTDPENYTLKFLHLLNKIHGDFEIIILIGVGYSFLDKLQKFIFDNNVKCTIIKDPKEVVDIFTMVDLGLLSFGVTAYEFAALGIPALYMCRTEDHKISSQLLCRENRGYVIGVENKIYNDYFNRIIGLFLNHSLPFNANRLEISNLKKITSMII